MIEVSDLGCPRQFAVEVAPVIACAIGNSHDLQLWARGYNGRKFVTEHPLDGCLLRFRHSSHADRVQRCNAVIVDRHGGAGRLAIAGGSGLAGRRRRGPFLLALETAFRVKIRYLPEFIGLMARLSPPYDTLSRAERGSPRAGGRKERRPCRHSRDRFAARDPSRWSKRASVAAGAIGRTGETGQSPIESLKATNQEEGCPMPIAPAATLPSRRVPCREPIPRVAAWSPLLSSPGPWRPTLCPRQSVIWRTQTSHKSNKFR